MKLELRFEGMTCLECARRIEDALKAVPGVDSAEVHYASRSGAVATSGRVPEAVLLDAVASTGYRAEIIRGGAAAVEEPAAPAGTQASQRQGGRGEGFDYDLVIIGSGGAGTAAAIRASELGASVAIVEGADVVGGTCVNVGCIPSKNLIEAAHHFHTARTAFPGIQPCDPQVSWSEILRQKREIVAMLRQEKYIDVLASYTGVTVLRGKATLLGGGRILVGDAQITGRKIIVATGASPSMPSIPGLAEAGGLDSTSAMELERLPASMIVVGGGSIGLELGQVFARFGVKVILVEALDRIMAGEDPDLSAALGRALEAEGMEIHTGVRVTGVARDEAGFLVRVQDGSVAGEIRAEQLLVATGRQPNTRGLGLDAAGVEMDDRGFIPVDEFMRTSAPHIYAAGDVTGGPGYVYVAALGGGIAAQAALSDQMGEAPIPIDLAATPRVTFTDPQVAAVGMSEEDARTAGIRPKVTSVAVKYLPRAVVSHRSEGLIKIIADAESDQLLGVHMAAPNAGDVIGEAVVAVRFGLRAQELVSTLHPYLTWGEGLKLAAQTFTKDVARLSCCA